MPLDPRIPLMGNVYQPDFGQIAQTRAQGMNVLSQMRQRDQELAQQNQLAAYIRGGGDPMNAGIYGEPGARIAELAMKRGELKIKQDEAAAKTQDKDRERQEKIFGTSLMRAYADPSDANMDERFADMEVAGIDTSPFRAMLAEVPDVNERKAQLGNFLTTTEEGRIFMDRFKSTPKEVNLGDRVVFIETNSNRDDFGQEITNLPVGATPSAQLNAEQERLNRASRERVAGISAKPSDKPVQTSSEPFNVLTKKMNDILTELDKTKEIPSTKRGLLSNVVPAMGASPVGQTIGKATGSKAQALRDEYTAIRPMLLQAIKDATGMSSQQLNSNVELQLYLNSLGNLSGTYEANKNILQNFSDFVASLIEEKQGAGGGAGAGGGGSAAVDFSDLD